MVDSDSAGNHLWELVMLWRAVAVCLFSAILSADSGTAQNTAPDTGDVTVRTSQVIDSAVLRVGQAVQGVVQSNSAEVPKGSVAFIALLPDPAGPTLKLIRIQANGRLLNASSSAVQLAPGLFNKVNNMRRGTGEPPVAVTGPRIFLHVNTDIVFTLAPAPAPPPPVPGGGQRIARQAPPPPPRHPANTVRDLPPAGPGYPPIHASHDAQQNCWWQPFVSTKFGLEAAVETCADKKMGSVVMEMEDGLGLQYQGDTPPNPPQRFVRVITKPADQPIEASIKQQFIMKQKLAPERTLCRVAKGFGNHTPDDTGVSKNDPNIQIYSVEAFGAYAKLKKFQGEDAEYPCAELHSNDAIGMSFQYNPTENKTKYLFFQEDDNGAVFDSDSVHFLPQ